jgi:MFS family permease
MTKGRILGVILATGLTSFLSTYLSSSVNIALKTIGAEFAVNPANLSLLASLYLLCSSLCIVPFGKLSDTYGPKRTLLFGCAFFTVSNLLVPLLARDFTSLLVLRGLQGVGSALLVVSNTPIITTAIPKEYRTTALGILSGLVYFGNSVGNFVGGVLTELFGWRSIFTSAAISCALAFVVLFLFVPNSERPRKEPRGLDIPGILTYAVMLISLQTGANQQATTPGKLLLLLSVVTLAFFVRHQKRTAHPIYDMRLFLSNKVFAMANIAVFLNFMATYGSQYLLPLYLQCNRGLSPMETGKITLFQPLMQIFFSPLAGFIASRIAPSLVASLGMAMIALALFALSWLSTTTPFVVIYGALALIGTGISFFSAPNTSIILESVPVNKRGMAAASNSIMRNLGMQCSVILCGSMLLLLLGQVKGIPPEKYDDMLRATKLCYAIFTGICLAGMVLSLKRSRSSGAEESDTEESARNLSPEETPLRAKP